MIVKLHKNARTTPAIRAQLAASNESVAVLALDFDTDPIFSRFGLKLNY